MKVTNPFKRGGRALAFNVAGVYPLDRLVVPEIGVECYARAQGRWRSDPLPTRGEYLVRCGGVGRLRGVLAVLRLEPPYLAAGSWDKRTRPSVDAGPEAVGLGWVGFHDFGHFRASQWVMRGIDLRTVQELLGHRDHMTTMRYAHVAPNHATRSTLAAHRAEMEELSKKPVAIGDK